MKVKAFLVPFGIFLLALGVTLYNIKGFPMMVGDEGIYVSQAWWLVHFHKLGPYTYWYDHFPLGWAQIGLWQLLAGGPFRFGLSVFSGRVFMAVIKAISAGFLFATLRKTTKSSSLGLLGALIFTLSPLALTFNRQVLLDNVASLWLIIHLYLWLTKKPTGGIVFLSSLSLVFAILSKESLLFVIPFYFLSVVSSLRTHQNARYFYLISFVTTVFLLSFFPLLAILKGEFIGNSHTVSFLETLRFQSTRAENSLSNTIKVWLAIDPVILIAGLGSVIFNLLSLWKNPKVRTLSLYSLGFILFLVRGGLVYDFYLIPLLPLLSMSITFTLNHLSSLLKSRWLISVFVLITALLFGYNSRYVFTAQATNNQIKSLEYVKSKANSNGTIVADNYNYLDLALDQSGNVQNSHVFWYSKAETDPAVKEVVLNNDPSKIDYLVVNDFLNRKLVGGELPFLFQAQSLLSTTTVFGNPPPPTSKPYTNESVTVYTRPSVVETTQEPSAESLIDQHFILSFASPALDKNETEFIQNTSVYGLLVEFQNVSNTSQLESLMHELNNIKASNTLLITHQSDSGKISLPWITTSLRVSYKSPLEAEEATTKKARELSTLGFQAAIITTATNEDGYLENIAKASLKQGIIPMLETSRPTFSSEDTNYLVFADNTTFKPQASNKEPTAIYLPSQVSIDDIQSNLNNHIQKFVIDINAYQKIRAGLIKRYQQDKEFRSLLEEK